MFDHNCEILSVWLALLSDVWWDFYVLNTTELSSLWSWIFISRAFAIKISAQGVCATLFMIGHYRQETVHIRENSAFPLCLTLGNLHCFQQQLRNHIVYHAVSPFVYTEKGVTNGKCPCRFEYECKMSGKHNRRQSRVVRFEKKKNLVNFR